MLTALTVNSQQWKKMTVDKPSNSQTQGDKVIREYYLDTKETELMRYETGGNGEDFLYMTVPGIVQLTDNGYHLQNSPYFTNNALGKYAFQYNTRLKFINSKDYKQINMGILAMKLWSGNYYSLYNLRGERLTNYVFDDIKEDYSQHRIIARSGNKYGIFKFDLEKGIWPTNVTPVTDPIFDEISPFYGFLTTTYRKGDYYGLIDTNGKIIVEAKYEEVKRPCENGFIPVKTQSGWGLLNPNGTFELSPTYSYVNEHRNGIYRIENGKGVGAYVPATKFLINCGAKNLWREGSRIIQVENHNGTIQLFDIFERKSVFENENITEITSDYMGPFVNMNYTISDFNDDTFYGFCQTKKGIVPFIMYYDRIKNKWVFEKKKDFSEILYFDGELIGGSKNGWYGIENLSGKVIIPYKHNGFYDKYLTNNPNGTIYGEKDYLLLRHDKFYHVYTRTGTPVITSNSDIIEIVFIHKNRLIYKRKEYALDNQMRVINCALDLTTGQKLRSNKDFENTSIKCASTSNNITTYAGIGMINNTQSIAFFDNRLNVMYKFLCETNHSRVRLSTKTGFYRMEYYFKNIESQEFYFNPSEPEFLWEVAEEE